MNIIDVICHMQQVLNLVCERTETCRSSKRPHFKCVCNLRNKLIIYIRGVSQK